MFMTNAIWNFYKKISDCNVEVDDAWKLFFVKEHPHIWADLPYHFVFTILLEVAIGR